MIVIHYIICQTCGHPHTLRIQVGHELYQEHTFHCHECEEEIVVGMDCNPDTASVQIKEIQNCDRGMEEGTIINLSPRFPIPKEDLHRDLAFPSFQHTQAFSKIQDESDIQAPSFSSLDEAQE